MDLIWLEDFLALADSGNFSRAADARHVTQPAFSRRIRGLEDWMGASLFDRALHPVALTEAGRRFRPVADELVRRLTAARDEARQADARAARTLRFAATHVLSFTFFPDWLRGIEARHGVTAVQLMSDSLDGCEQLMLQGQAQFLLSHHHAAAPGRLDGDGFRAVAVGADLLLPVAAPDEAGHPRFLLKEGGPALPHLAYSRESGLGRIHRAAGPGRLRLDPVFTSHLAAALRTMAEAGRGIAWLPRSLIARDLAEGRLVRAGDEILDIPVEIRLIRPAADQGEAAEGFWREAGGRSASPGPPA